MTITSIFLIEIFKVDSGDNLEGNKQKEQENKAEGLQDAISIIPSLVTMVKSE